MIIEHKTIDLFGKKLFEKVTVASPLKNHNPIPEEACFFYVMEGINHTYSEEDHLILQANDGALMKCGNYIYEGIPSETSSYLSFIAIHLYPEVITKIYENNLPTFLTETTAFPQKNMTAIRSDLHIANYMESLLLYFEQPSLMTIALIKLKFQEFIQLLLQTEKGEGVRAIIRHFFHSRKVTFKEVINAHIFSELSINDLAALTNLSLASFKREFKKHYDDSPANYIKNQRLHKAAELLLVTDKQINEIAYECHFNDPAHFSTVFKAKYELSPLNYRLSLKHK